MTLPDREALYGGAAGGGKSDALLMAALMYVDVPGYSAILFRRTYTDLSLPDALMDRSHQWLNGTAAKWNDRDKRWIFPSGATLSFGYLESERDKYRYQSAAFQFIGFDELTQFTESQYLYLFSRLRRVESLDVPLRMRAASNPGGVGHDWVNRRFNCDGRQLGEFPPFIRATLDDNPHLDRDEYRESLSYLDPVTREQLLNGDWTARQDGGMFRREWFRVVDDAPAGMPKVRFWDLAATPKSDGGDPDYTVGALMGLHDGVWYVLDIRRTRGTPAQVEALVKQTAEMDGRGVSICIEQEPGSSGVNTIDHYARRVLVGYNFRGTRSTGSKIERARPLSSAAEAGNVCVLNRPWVRDLLDELELFPNGPHDDQVDALSGAMAELSRSNVLVVW